MRCRSDGKWEKDAQSGTAEIAVPYGQSKFILKFALYATQSDCFNFTASKWLAFSVFKAFSLLVALILVPALDRDTT